MEKKEEQPQSCTRTNCMVNMSRMTGRKDNLQELGDWGNVDVMHSLRYVKRSLTKNIDFRPNRRQKIQKNNISNANSSSYDYDYTVLKPQRGKIDFGSLRGRDEKVKTESSYGYQHYDFDSYVWENKSQVYRNTKTHVADFGKQRNRYTEKQSV